MRFNSTSSIAVLLRASLGFALLAGCVSEPTYSLVVVGASLMDYDPSNHGCPTWDCSVGLAPDPYVVVRSNAGVFREVHTATRADALQPRWDEVVAEGVTAGELARGVTLHVYDEDDTIFARDDLIVSFELWLTREQVVPGPITLTTMVGSQVSTLTVEIR